MCWIRRGTALALLIGTTPASSLAMTAREETQLSVALVTQVDSAKWTTVERTVLTSAPGRARRQGAALRLALDKGRSVTLRNTSCDEDATGNLADDCHQYVLAAILPSVHAYLVMDGHYEGGDVLLVDDRTGRRTVLDAVPTFSPDGTQFLTIDDDVAYGTDPEFEVWRRDGDTASVVWSGQTEGLDLHYSTDVRWRTPDRIDLTMHAYAPTWGAGPTWPVALTAMGRAWRIEMSPPDAAKAR